MKNRILPLLLAALFCLATVCPLGAYAAALDTEADASLTLRYQAEEQGFADLQIEIFRDHYGRQVQVRCPRQQGQVRPRYRRTSERTHLYFASS